MASKMRLWAHSNASYLSETKDDLEQVGISSSVMFQNYQSLQTRNHQLQMPRYALY